jgi:hypothetical protein
MKRRARYTPLLLLCLPLLLLVPALAEAATAAGLAAEFGVGEVRSGARRWSKSELALLDGTLEALHRRELKAVQGVDFVRGGAPRRPLGTGLFSWDRRGRRITIYNGAFADDPNAPNWTVVHEIGHAISAWDLVLERRRSKAAIDAYEVTVTTYNDRIHAYNDAARRFNRTQDAGAKRDADRLKRELGPLHSKMQTARNKALGSKRMVRFATRQFRAARPRDGVLADYRAVLGRHRSPTRYGRTSLRESFAESYAMYRCEPKRLRKLLPTVFQWFSEGGHIARIP